MRKIYLGRIAEGHRYVELADARGWRKFIVRRESLFKEKVWRVICLRIKSKGHRFAEWKSEESLFLERRCWRTPEDLALEVE